MGFYVVNFKFINTSLEEILRQILNLDASNTEWKLPTKTILQLWQKSAYVFEVVVIIINFITTNT